MNLYDRINSKMIGRLATFPEELDLLVKYTEIEGDHLEIGCLWGGTAILTALSKIKKKVSGHVYTVDFMQGGMWVKGDHEHGYEIPSLEKIMQNIKTFRVGKRVSVIVDKSNPLPIPKDVKPVTVLIDGDHREAGCLLDWMNANHLKPEYVLIHDCDEIHPGVQKVVEYITAHEPEWEMIEQAKSMVVFKRIKPATPRPTVSVIVPTYNRPELLERALTSIDKQTFKNYEIVVVNDAGVNVWDVVKRHKKTVLIEHMENKGLSASRNTGIKASKGKYVTFLDDDDVILPFNFKVLVKAMEEGASLAYADYYVWKNETELVKAPAFDYNKSILSRRNIMAVFGSMTRRELFELELFDETLLSHEDYDMWLRMSKHVDFVHVPKYTGYYSIRDGSGQISNQDYHAEWMRIVRKKHGLDTPTAAPKIIDGYVNARIIQNVAVSIDNKSAWLTKDDNVKLPKELASELNRAGYVQY